MRDVKAHPSEIGERARLLERAELFRPERQRVRGGVRGARGVVFPVPLLDELGEAYGFDVTGQGVEEIVRTLGTFGALVGATLQNTANPTMLEAGYKHNVIPTEASAAIDGRVLPGFEE